MEDELGLNRIRTYSPRVKGFMIIVKEFITNTWYHLYVNYYKYS